jgi:hypothetical protein
MPYRGQRLLKCPACGKRGVQLHLRAGGEDGYSCRYCDDFDAFSYSDLNYDRARLWALQETNPDANIHQWNDLDDYQKQRAMEYVWERAS